MNTPLAVVIITKNEEKRIRTCLESLKGLPAQIILVDDESTDQTVDIARIEFGARIIPYRSSETGVSFFKQRNAGIDAAASKWILQLDADEVVTNELRHEIIEIISAPSEKTDDVYKILKRDCIFKVPLMNLRIAPGPKLFKKGRARYVAGAIHETLEIEKGSRTGILNGFTLHYNYDSIAKTIEKYNFYTSIEALEYVKKNKNIDYQEIKRQLSIKNVKLFFKFYIKKKGHKDGIYGLVWCLINIIHPTLFWLKVIEFSKLKNKTNL